MRLIDADALMAQLEDRQAVLVKEWGYRDHYTRGFEEAADKVGNAPSVDAVSRGVHEQVRWERDVAIEQLESYGVSLGEKAEVAKVVQGRWIDGIGSWSTCKCSVCNWRIPYSWDADLDAFKFCPNCGADMRERKDNG